MNCKTLCLLGSVVTASAAVISGGMLSGCSTSHKQDVEQALDAKLEQEAAVTSRADLKAVATGLVDNTAGLDEREKKQLKAIRDETAAASRQIRLESLKLQAVLVRDVIAPSEKKKEVAAISRRLRELEQERLSLIFSAVHEANTVMGRWPSSDQRLNAVNLDEMTNDFFDL